MEDRREILSCLGSNLLLTDKKLEVSLDTGLGMFLEVAPEVQAFHNRLEPIQVLDTAEGWGKIYDKNKKWGQLQDVFSNPTIEFKEEILTFNTALKILNEGNEIIFNSK